MTGSSSRRPPSASSGKSRAAGETPGTGLAPQQACAAARGDIGGSAERRERPPRDRAAAPDRGWEPVPGEGFRPGSGRALGAASRPRDTRSREAAAEAARYRTGARRRDRRAPRDGPIAAARPPAGRAASGRARAVPGPDAEPRPHPRAAGRARDRQPRKPRGRVPRGKGQEREGLRPPHRGAAARRDPKAPRGLRPGAPAPRARGGGTARRAPARVAGRRSRGPRRRPAPALRDRLEPSARGDRDFRGGRRRSVVLVPARGVGGSRPSALRHRHPRERPSGPPHVGASRALRLGARGGDGQPPDTGAGWRRWRASAGSRAASRESRPQRKRPSTRSSGCRGSRRSCGRTRARWTRRFGGSFLRGW